MPAPDLWPTEFGQGSVQPPISILREQADHLGKKTQGKVTARIQTRQSGKDFMHTFFLVAPSLENYTYSLFYVQHPVDLYPATIMDPSQNIQRQALTPEQFMEKLGMILGSDETKRVMRSLLAQTQALAG